MSAMLLSVLSFARAGTKAGKDAHRAAMLENIRTAAARYYADKDLSALVNTRYALGDTLKFGTDNGRVHPADALSSAAVTLSMTVENLSKVKAWRVQATLGLLRFVECTIRTETETAGIDFEAITARLVAIDAGKPKAVNVVTQADADADAIKAAADESKAAADDEGEQANPQTDNGTVTRAEYDAMKARAELAETRADEAANNATQTSAALEKARATINSQAAELAKLHDVIKAMSAGKVETVEAKPVRTGGKRKPAALEAVAA
jgi:hypothetical protein